MYDRFKTWGDEFQTFILRGNVVDLAVAVVIGLAFQNVVNAIVKDLITPLIALIYGGSQFANSYFTINGSQFRYGDLINVIIYFLIIAAVVFFLVVKPINTLHDKVLRSPDTEEPSTRKCPYCLAEVPIEATKCQLCTSDLSPESERSRPVPA